MTDVTLVVGDIVTAKVANGVIVRMKIIEVKPNGVYVVQYQDMIFPNGDPV